MGKMVPEQESKKKCLFFLFFFILQRSRRPPAHLGQSYPKLQLPKVSIVQYFTIYAIYTL